MDSLLSFFSSPHTGFFESLYYFTPVSLTLFSSRSWLAPLLQSAPSSFVGPDVADSRFPPPSPNSRSDGWSHVVGDFSPWRIMPVPFYSPRFSSSVFFRMATVSKFPQRPPPGPRGREEFPPVEPKVSPSLTLVRLIYPV